MKEENCYGKLSIGDNVNAESTIMKRCLMDILKLQKSFFCQKIGEHCR